MSGANTSFFLRGPGFCKRDKKRLWQGLRAAILVRGGVYKAKKLYLLQVKAQPPMASPPSLDALWQVLDTPPLAPASV